MHGVQKKEIRNGWCSMPHISFTLCSWLHLCCTLHSLRAVEAHEAVKPNTQCCAWSVLKASPAPALPPWRVTPGTQGWSAQQEQGIAASSPESQEAWGNRQFYPPPPPSECHFWFALISFIVPIRISAAQAAVTAFVSWSWIWVWEGRCWANAVLQMPIPGSPHILPLQDAAVQPAGERCTRSRSRCRLGVMSRGCPRLVRLG